MLLAFLLLLQAGEDQACRVKEMQPKPVARGTAVESEEHTGVISAKRWPRVRKPDEAG